MSKWPIEKQKEGEERKGEVVEREIETFSNDLGAHDDGLCGSSVSAIFLRSFHNSVNDAWFISRLLVQVNPSFKSVAQLESDLLGLQKRLGEPFLQQRRKPWR